MGIALPAKVFRNGEGQAVSIPHGLELPGEDVLIRQEGLRLIITPLATNSANQPLLDTLATLEPLDEDIGEIEDFPPRPVEI